MKAKNNRYSYPLKMDGKLKEPLTKVAKKNRRDLNKEINVAIENHLLANGETIKQN